MLQTLERQLPKVPVRLCLLISLLLHLCGAWFCDGFFHLDEHFQILEFAGFKLGISPASDLAWEYPAKIRSAIQPAITYGVYGLAVKLHAANPFAVAFILRLCAALCAWLVTVALCVIGLGFLAREDMKKLFFLISCFFWCFPFFHCRFSSENCSGIAFFGALCLILFVSRSTQTSRAKNLAAIGRFMLAGFLFGMAFFMRFQIGIAIIGISLWLIFIHKASYREMAVFFIAFCFACFLNIGIDRWFYGLWTLTPVSYFNVNILKHASDQFGVSPWWYYFVQIVINLAPPYSLLLAAAMLLTLYKCPKNPMVWISVPFILLHCCIGHKELRFLFPLLYALPLLLVLGVDSLSSTAMSRLHQISKKKAIRFFLYSSVAINMALLVVFSFKPGKETTVIQKWIYDTGAKNPFTLYTINGSPYKIGDAVPLNFYRTPRVTLSPMCCADSLKHMIKEKKMPITVWMDSFNLPDSLKDPSVEWKVECRSIPQWLDHFDINHWLSRIHAWTIFSARPKGRL